MIWISELYQLYFVLWVMLLMKVDGDQTTITQRNLLLIQEPSTLIIQKQLEAERKKRLESVCQKIQHVAPYGVSTTIRMNSARGSENLSQPKKWVPKSYTMCQR